MVRSSFDLKLKELHQSLRDMGNHVEIQVKNSIIALKNHDIELAEKIIKDDDIVDNYEAEIESNCIKLLVTENPLAVDLRKIFIATKIITDLERIADHAVDIAKITILLKDEEYVKNLTDITRMGELVEKMIKGTLEAYVNMDVELSREICDMDDEVDEIYESIYMEVAEIMKVNPDAIKQCSRFLIVSRLLERMADHTTNICERIIYVETGERVELN